MSSSCSSNPSSSRRKESSSLVSVDRFDAMGESPVVGAPRGGQTPPRNLDGGPEKVRLTSLDPAVLEEVGVSEALVNRRAVLVYADEASPARAVAVLGHDLLELVLARGDDALLAIELQNAVAADQRVITRTLIHDVFTERLLQQLPVA